MIDYLNSSNENWVETSDRFVALLDIMGFKELVFRGNHEELKMKLKSLEKHVFFGVVRPKIVWQHQKSLRPAQATPSFQDKDIRIIRFSDSILLVTGDDSLESAQLILNTIQELFDWAFNIGIPLKGAIAYGRHTASNDNSLEFGIPLIDCYEIQKDLIMYSVILHHTMEALLKEKGYMTSCQPKWLCEHNVPFRSNKVKHFVVKFDSSAVAALPLLYATVSGPTLSYVDNTMSFAQSIQK